ncbi:type IV secretion protein Rhs [Streptomyces sp. CB02923]|uniref:VgrG-related protein n=1 Tax=Streptomyces sp. CB02923 TaxID=1718985 RepID=UPI00093B44DF|nr:VgrG-related protein [Streptomyces sp. CB02923]OKI03418.1 type IV secretion protein Rhs [Streptomyces sp. CB02923]
MAGPATSALLQVSIGSGELPDDAVHALVDGWVDQGAGVPAAFQLTFRDPQRIMISRLGATFGTPVTIATVTDGQGAGDTLLTGEITGFEADYDGTGTFTVIRGYDFGHRLMRQRRVAAYRNQSASDIARKLAARDGVPVGTIQPTKTVYEFISQSNVTDWDFLARLADENETVMSVDAQGRFCFVRPKPATGAPPTSIDGEDPLELKAGIDILRLRAAVTAADQVGTVEARGWDVTQKKALSSVSPAKDNPGFAIGETPGAAAGRFKAGKLVETSTPYDKSAEVRFASDSLADDVTGAFAEVEVVVLGNTRLRPGVPVTLSDTGAPFEGKYTATSVRHVFGDGKHYESWVTVSGRQWRSLFGLASGGGGTGAGPRLPSVANALVTDVNDPLKQGRVRLRFPWLDDTYVSDWTRTVQLGGLGGGGVFPMDVNDEVLVGFDRGALDHPFVIGGLYNGKDRPTAVGDVPLHDAVRKKASRHTVSDRDGNRVDLLSQKTGGRKQGVRLASGDKRLTISLDRTKTEIVVDSKGSVTIKGSRSVSVEAGTDLTLSARRRLSLQSGGLLSIRSGGPLTVDSTGLINLKSVGQIGLTTGGALNMTAGGVSTLTAGGSIQLTSAANMINGAKTTVTSPLFFSVTPPVPPMG